MRQEQRQLDKQDISTLAKNETLASLAREAGLKYTTVRERLARGDTLERALRPVKSYLYAYRGRNLTVTQWAKLLGMTRNTLYSRLCIMTIGQAIRRPYKRKVVYELVGRRFGRLTVLGKAKDKRNRPVFICKCDCGNTTRARGYNLVRGQYKCRSKVCDALPRDSSNRPKPYQLACDMGLKAEYLLWRARRRDKRLPLEWLDFWAFIEDVGPRPGTGVVWQLRKENKDGPFDATNVGWIRMVV